MPITQFFDPLLLLLDDPELLAGLLSGEDPSLADSVPAATGPQAEPSIDDAAIDAAISAELVAAFGFDPTTFDDIDALIASLAPPDASTAGEVADLVSDAGSWETSWSEPVREDWAVG